jgi:drug/metabolite transporter (DMT)-like permease
LSYFFNEPFSGFSNAGWGVLVTQAIICQLLWLLINYAIKHMRATRVSVSLLAQGILASVLAWIFLNESITLQMVFGGLVLLMGIRVTFYTKQSKFTFLKKRTAKAPL